MMCNKKKAYDFRYFAIGNSFMNHGYFNGWPWVDAEKGNRGMAASLVEKDYFHRTIYYLTHSEDFYGSIKYKQLGGNWEVAVGKTILTKQDSENHEFCVNLKKQIEEFKPNIFTVQLAENVRCNDAKMLEEVYDGLYGVIANAVPKDCIVVAITVFWDNLMSQTVKKVAKKYGFLVNDMSFVAGLTDSKYNGNRYKNEYLAYEQYKDCSTVEIFGSHPGDFGHDEIAKRNFEQIKSVLSKKLTEKYITLPSELSIVGTDSLCNDGEITNFTVLKSDITDNSVNWSVDNDNIAIISENGTLTAVNDGKVTVIAKSSYDENIIATKTVEISGQSACYTATFVGGADDNSIKNLPDPIGYVKSVVALPKTAPTRRGYKFVGWSKQINGEIVNNIEISEDTAFFALWEIADSWLFNHGYSFEGLSCTMPHAKVDGGILSGVPFEGKGSVYNNELLIDSNVYKTFVFKSSIHSQEQNQKFEIVIKTSDENFVFNKDVLSSEMTEYTVSLCNVTGTILGFEITPSILNGKVEFEKILFSPYFSEKK